jgi:two-component system CheB/CheR fusion protein
MFERQVRDHANRWYLLRILPYRSKTAFDGIVITLIDMTSLKRAEESIRQKDSQLSAILASSPHLVSIKDLEGRYLVTDAAFQRVAGCDPIGRTNAEIFAPEVARHLDGLDRQVLGGATTLETEVVIPLPDGPHTYLTIKFPMRDDAGAIIGVSSIKTDVTRLKRAELKAREAVEQRDRFLAVLSHELRNPLGAIVNAAAVLQQKGMPDSARTDALGVLQRQANQMSRLLDDLLEVSRITQDKFHLSKEPLKLGDVIDQAVRAARPTLEKSRVRLTVECDDDTPAIEGDAVRLQQLAVNLLTNAAKYSTPEGEVRLATRREGAMAVLQVTDSGVGVRPDLLPKIFDLFVQAENSLDRTNAGLGVGLSLVRAITELHGGTVEAKSDGVGKGSEFTVRIPAAEGFLATVPEGGRVAILEDGFSRRLDGPVDGKIVLVEDNDDSRRILESLLKVEVREVHAERDGKAGLARIEAVRPDAAILDIGLPELTGYEVAREVRKKLGNAIYLVALTGYGREEDRRAVMHAGFDEHFVKPLKQADLEKILERLSASSRN